MADVGQGSTITLVGLGDFDAVSMTKPGRSITSHDVTKLSDTEAKSLPGRLVKNAMLKCRGHVGDGVEPTVGWEGTAILTLPIPAGMTTARSYTFTGFVSNVGDVQIDNDGVMFYDFDFTVNTADQTDES